MVVCGCVRGAGGGTEGETTLFRKGEHPPNSTGAETGRIREEKLAVLVPERSDLSLTNSSSVWRALHPPPHEAKQHSVWPARTEIHTSSSQLLPPQDPAWETECVCGRERERPWRGYWAGLTAFYVCALCGLQQRQHLSMSMTAGCCCKRCFYRAF